MTVLQRYDGRDLGDAPHITLLGSCKIGNFIVSVPLLESLRRRYPHATIDFWGSELTRDFEEAHPAINWRCSWDRSDPGQFSQLATAAEKRRVEAGPIDLLVNCDGFNPLTQVLAAWLQPHWVAGASLTANGRRDLPWGEHPYQRFLADPDWDSPAFLARYPGLFGTNYIGELLCRLAYQEPILEAVPLPWREPPFAVPDLLIHCTTTRSAKIWPFANWCQVADWCERNGISVGLVGSAPARQRDEYHAGDEEDRFLADTCVQDLRGRTSLIQLAGACRQARAVVSVDAGPLHIAAAMGTPTLAVVGNDADGVGASPIRLWMPRADNCSRTVSSVRCDGCAALRFRNSDCVQDEHICMHGVLPDQVTSWLAQQLLPA